MAYLQRTLVRWNNQSIYPIIDFVWNEDSSYTQFLRENWFIMELSFDPLHQILHIFRSRDFYRFLDRNTICPPVLVSAEKVLNCHKSFLMSNFMQVIIKCSTMIISMQDTRWKHIYEQRCNGLWNMLYIVYRRNYAIKPQRQLIVDVESWLIEEGLSKLLCSGCHCWAVWWCA